jgi:CRP-like cAMP-binding protein
LTTKLTTKHLPAERSASASENRLLAALQPDEYERLSSSLELVRLPRNRILYEAGEPIQHAYFLNSGMASFLSITEDGETIDICMVGNEGLIGDDIIARVGITPCRVMTQFPCDALRLGAAQLIDEFNRGGRLQELLLRYSHVLKTQLVQASVCLPFHTYRQRLSRWLLVTSDCLQSDSFNLTQEHIAIMLGKHRNRISKESVELKRRGLLDYNRRGRMTILDRQALERTACECYSIVRKCINNSFDI